MEEGGRLPLQSMPLSQWRGCSGVFPGDVAQVRLVRGFLTGFLDGCQAAGDAVLLASELAANAIAHSASGKPGGSFAVRVRVRGSTWVHVEVEDQGSDWNGNLDVAECPHGLFLLHQLATTCGTRPGDQGWITWFTIGDLGRSRCCLTPWPGPLASPSQADAA